MSDANDVIELESMAGSHISSVCEEAAKIAHDQSKPVHFVFNDTHVTAQPGETKEELVARWDADFQAAAKAWRESPECAAQQAKRAAEDKAADEAHHVELATTEAAMRDAKVPWIRTKDQLVEYVESLVNRGHDYGTCVYALSMAAEAAFHYVSHRLGVTGFQANYADLDFLRRTRNMQGPFMIINANDALYPQYDLVGKVNDALREWQPWLKDEAKKNLAEKSGFAHPNVVQHWKDLAKGR